MSVQSMTALASSPARIRRADDQGVKKAVRDIADYIPSEAVATYLLLLGILVPAAGTPDAQVQLVKVISFLAGLAMAVVLVPLTFKRGSLPDGEARSRQLWLALFAVVAFVAYSAATPGGPWTGSILGIAVSQWGAAVAAILAVLLPRLAVRLNLRRDEADQPPAPAPSPASSGA